MMHLARAALASLMALASGGSVVVACGTFTSDGDPEERDDAGVQRSDAFVDGPAIPDGASVDAGPDSPSRCERDTALWLCDDFDHPPPSGQWAPWDQAFAAPPGTASPTYDNELASSKPNSLRVDTGRNGSNRTSFLIKTFATANGWTTFAVSTRVYLAHLFAPTGSENADVTMLLVRLLHSGEGKRQIYYRLSRNVFDGGTAVVGSLQGLAPEYLARADFGTSVPMGAWFDLTTRIHNEGSSVWIEVLQNNVTVVSRYDVELTPPVSSIVVNLGSEIAGEGAGADIRFDDVTIGE